MKLKILVGVLVFLIVVNLATIGSYLYFRWHRGHEDGPPMPLPPRGQELMAKLNEDQRKKLRELVDQFDADTRDRRDSVRTLEFNTFSMIREDSVNYDKVNANLAEISRIRLDLSQFAAKRILETKSFLTKEQRELFFGAIAMGGGGRPGGPHGGPPGGFRDGRPPFRGGPPRGRMGGPPNDGPPMGGPDDGPPGDGPPPDGH